MNYEARTNADDARKKAKRKLKNYKLKHSRMLTCYSALLFLLATKRLQGTVTPQDALAMVGLSPTMRLDWLEGEMPNVSVEVKALTELYARFLDFTNAEEEHLIERFFSPKDAEDFAKQAYEFGDALFSLLEKVGTNEGGSKERFFRLLVV